MVYSQELSAKCVCVCVCVCVSWKFCGQEVNSQIRVFRPVHQKISRLLCQILCHSPPRKDPCCIWCQMVSGQGQICVAMVTPVNNCVFARGRQLSLWITGCCCYKMAKGGKLEPWNWHILVQLL